MFRKALARQLLICAQKPQVGARARLCNVHPSQITAVKASWKLQIRTFATEKSLADQVIEDIQEQ
jgi:hypothetical protein